MTTRRRIPGPVMEKIEALALKGWSGGQIYREIGEAVSLKTVQRILKDFRPKDASGTWEIGGSPGPEAGAILRALAELAEYTEGHKRSFTQNEAAWVARMGLAAPTLSGMALYTLAVECIRRGERHESTHDVAHFLAYRSWESLEASTRYWDAVDKGWIDPPRGFLFRLVAEERARRYEQSAAPMTEEQQRASRRLAGTQRKTSKRTKGGQQ